jgi:3-methyladenine DNA glycosylase AlkC
MADALKDFYSPDKVRAIGAAIAAVHPGFSLERWQAEAMVGFDDLALTGRGRQLARALRAQLPDDYPTAIEILLASLGRPLDVDAAPGMAPFFYLPHTYYVADYGLDDFEISMRALHALTQRFTAEFSIRLFLERYPGPSLARLREWAGDPSHHVRRLVSEGTRPRLPWAPRLRAFQKDPGPVLELLELLKDDASLYVRRSVANNLNDIGKDHPELLAATCRRWLEGATPERRWLVQHALRSAVKRGEQGALAVVGAADAPEVEILDVTITPAAPRIGEKLRFQARLRNVGAAKQTWVVDLAVYFVKANGQASAKVFKLKNAEPAPGEVVDVGKTITLADLTTRRHYPGHHALELRINGRPFPVGGFELAPH